MKFPVWILAAVTVSAADRTQDARPDEDPLTAIQDLRMKLSHASLENGERLRSFQFNRGLGSVCLYDIDDMLDELDEQLSRIETLIGFRGKVVSADDAISILVRTETKVALAGLDPKRRRIELSTHICGSIPIVVSRAQLALSLLNGAEDALSHLR